MNLYFLVEGFTESDFYPELLKYHFGSKLTRVEDHTSAESNNYYLIGNGGYPFVYTGSKDGNRTSAFLKNAILDINSYPVYNYLILCLDADEESIEGREKELNTYLKQYAEEGVILDEYCEIKIIAQNRCIETWFLGNKAIYKSNPTEEPLISYTKYYNLKKNDPELMGNYNDVYSYQDFHHQYLRELFRAKKMTYKKGMKGIFTSSEYIKAIRDRAKAREKHIQSFNVLMMFLDYVNDKIDEYE